MHGFGNIKEVFEKFAGDVFIGGVVMRQLDGRPPSVWSVEVSREGALATIAGTAGQKNARFGIRLVQVSDFKVGTVASSQRLVPGDGDVPVSAGTGSE